MHNGKGQPARRTMVVTASGALLASAATVGVVGGTTVAADAAPAKGTYAYKCKANAGGQDLGTAKVKVTVKTKLPAKVKRGKKLAKRPIGVSLRMPENLRKGAVDVLQATHASGTVRGAKLGVKIGKLSRKAKISGLKAKKAKIPAQAGKPWKVTAKGKLAAIKVPKKTKAKKVKLSVPKRFKATAKLHREDGSTIKANLSCKGPNKRGFDSVKIVR